MTSRKIKSRKRIAIVGAGIAGMALAIMATQQGHKVSLYERKNEVSSLGAGVTLWPNAMFVLQQMGLEQDILRAGGRPAFMRQFDANGTQQGEFSIEQVNQLSGYASVTILRRDLMKVLANALDKLAIQIHFGKAISAIHVAALQQEFDLVVGADGRMNSVVRQALFTGSEAVNPIYQGFINIIGISQLAAGEVENCINDIRIHGERFGIVPISDSLCYWAAGWSTPMDKERPLSSWYKEMHQRFRHWPETVQKVLTSYQEGSLNRIFVHDLDPLPYWHKDNTLIIGDAAHAPLPTSGQGACQALEDVWHLMQVLKKERDLNSALERFYQRRIAKTTAAQMNGRQIAKLIFTCTEDTKDKPSASPVSISAEQLSQYWMQGLDIH